ncbi:hypothetical protein QX204_05655 [Nocardia sp. PE-7]|uniref:hypothetical protein n=1 Tax=Nocardia sp. PE-7 TaxID=3058426 RepID=UPI00265A8482|nr:hypothetical protein [Nocardia sp. PE-7]WKG10970.1 hypothetical protein QX204_05655 [Nocardia sp. PE-7]
MQQGGVGEAWQIGSSAVAVRPAELARIDDACAEFLGVIARIRALAVEVGDQTQWGLGEGQARLISGSALVARLRSVAAAKENSIVAVSDAHSRAVGDIRRSFRDARDLMVIADEEWAYRLRSVETFVGQQISTESV